MTIHHQKYIFGSYSKRWKILFEYNYMLINFEFYYFIHRTYEIALYIAVLVCRCFNSDTYSNYHTVSKARFKALFV